jgi:(2Fe-2S) ferredoxin
MFSTVHSPTFTPYYSLWYQNVDSRKVKQVPNSLKLNGQVVAHWIADDGFVTYNKLPHRLQCDFATQGFSKSEVEFLASLLNDRYGEEFLIKPKRRNDKMYYIIRAYDSACRAMFLDIDPYFKMERKRIWDKPESRFWSNQPERQRSTIHDFANRKVLLAKIIDAGEPITMKELAKQLGYTDGGKPGYANVNKLLKPYTDAGRIVKEFDNMNYNAVTIRIVKGI